MSRLEAMQRLADSEAAKLGIDAPITVVFSGAIVNEEGKACRCGRDQYAHAHCYKSSPVYGTICVKRGLGAHWRDTIKHEVAHFVKGGMDHGGRGRISGFVRARAQQGDPSARLAMVRAGKMRCAKHEWERSHTISQKMTSRGLTITYAAACWKCGKTVPA